MKRFLPGIAIAAALAGGANAATITIVPGAGFDDTTPRAPEGGNPGVTVGAQRLFAFQQAAALWGAMLNSSQTISVNAQFVVQNCTQSSAQLGSAGATAFFFVTIAGTLRVLPVALAEAMTSTNLNNANREINANFNSRLDAQDPQCLGGNRWYYGINGPRPSGTAAFFPTVLHELGHGLGFTTIVCDDPSGCNTVPFGGYPIVSANEVLDTWGTRMRDLGVGQLWPSMTPAQRASSFTSINNLVWDGPAVNAALGGFGFSGGLNAGRMKMYAPNPLEPGSSVAHWDETAFPNLLMEPFADADVFNTTDLTGAAFADIGWSVNGGGGGSNDPIFLHGFE